MFQIGDHILSPRRGIGRFGLYTHHGIYVGNGQVIHFAGVGAATPKGRIERVDLAEFADGRPIFVRRYGALGFNRVVIAARARSRLGQGDYSVTENNCEHFATWCSLGEHHSAQINRIRLALAAYRLARRISDAVAYSALAPFVMLSRYW